MHIVHGNLVTHQGQVVSSRQAGGAAADDSHSLAGGLGAGRILHIAGHVNGVALQAADIDGAVHHVPAAAVLTGMLADVSAGGGEGIVLADQLHGVSAAALMNQSHIAGDIHGSRTLCHTGDGILHAAQAAAGLHMLLKVIPEGHQCVQHQLTGIDTDGAVGGVHNHLSGGLDPVQNVCIGLAVQNLANHLGQLIQADTAGNTLTTGLSLAQIQEVQGHIHRAQAGRIGFNPALHAAVNLLDDCLSLSGHFYFKSTHFPSCLSWISIRLFSFWEKYPVFCDYVWHFCEYTTTAHIPWIW